MLNFEIAMIFVVEQVENIAIGQPFPKSNDVSQIVKLVELEK
jgi:hypothetical protein